MCVCCGTFDVLGQGLPRAGVLDAVSTPGGEELDQPGRGRVRHGGLQAAAAQDHQRVLLRVQPGGGRHTPGEEPEADRRRFEPEPEHPCGPDRDTRRAEPSRERAEPRAGRQTAGEVLPKTSRERRADMRAATCVFQQRADVSLRAGFTRRPPN